jgi:hypothetical protein
VLFKGCIAGIFTVSGGSTVGLQKGMSNSLSFHVQKFLSIASPIEEYKIAFCRLHYIRTSSTICILSLTRASSDTVIQVFINLYLKAPCFWQIPPSCLQICIKGIYIGYSVDVA